MDRRAFLSGVAAVAAAALLPRSMVSMAADGEPEIDRALQAGKSTSFDVVDPADYGAVGDGVVDDTSALQEALAALTPGAKLVIARDKTYNHAATLSVTAEAVTITGGGTLHATNYDQVALYLSADNITVDGLIRTFSTSGIPRQNAYRHHMLVLDKCDGATVRNCTVNGSPATGIFVWGASRYIIDSPQVRNTLADGIHQTAGSHLGRVLSPVIKHTGDDGIAVVSYQNPSDVNFGLCHDIEIVKPHVVDSYVARGVAVVGGRNVILRDITVEASSSAAIFIACEASFETYGCDDVLVDGALITSANTIGTERPNQGAVFLASDRGGFALTNITVRDVTASNTASDVSHQGALVLNNGGTASNVLIERFIAQGSGPDLMFHSTAPSSSYTLIDVRRT